MENSNNTPSIYYPPGGILIWIIVIIELLTFGMGLIAFVYYGNTNKELFTTSCNAQHFYLAFMNTLVLLSSGFCMAEAVRTNKIKNLKQFQYYLIATLFFGAVFVILKLVDYSLKMKMGIGIETNNYYMFYWLLTAFHFFHVLLGMLFLVVLFWQKKNYMNEEFGSNLQSAAIFWHLCDVIWLLIFPVLFILFKTNV